MPRRKQHLNASASVCVCVSPLLPVTLRRQVDPLTPTPSTGAPQHAVNKTAARVKKKEANLLLPPPHPNTSHKLEPSPTANREKFARAVAANLAHMCS